MVSTWRGYAFEYVCFNHIKEIKKALGISGVISNVSAWSKNVNYYRIDPINDPLSDPINDPLEIADIFLD